MAKKGKMKKEVSVEECECCSLEETKSAEDMVRDIINFVNVKKEEEAEGATHRIEADTAEELTEKLEELARKVSGICK